MTKTTRNKKKNAHSVNCERETGNKHMELFDHVRIISSGITGIIVDISGGRFTVEADKERTPSDDSGYPGRWPLYTCSANELDLIK